MKEKNRYIKYILFFISAAFFLAIASRSSFMYVCNNWDDANSYFSVGKSLFNGKMPYRDVFDQKGMYLYFFYGLCYLVSHRSFLGVYIMEILFGIIDIAGFYRILRLYTNEKASLLFAPMSFAVITVSRSFWWGGAAEEICLPFYIWGLYLILKYFRQEYADGKMKALYVFIGGLLAGMIANIKFTGLGFFFAWMMLVWLSFIVHKDFVGSLKACVVFLIGMFIPFIPWIIYFGIQSSLYEWYWGYVFINVFLYPNTSDVTLFVKIYNLTKILYFLILDNYHYFVFAIAGLVYSVFAKGQKILTRLVSPVLFSFMFLGIFVGGRTLPYYSLPLSIFAVLGFALIGTLLEKMFEKKKTANTEKNMKNQLSAAFFGVYGLLTVALAVIIFNCSMNVPFMKEDEQSYFMFRFRDEVLEKENPTLLNVGCLDAGLYTLTGIIPSCRWFQTQTLDIPEAENNPYLEQDRYVREGLVDFVVARDDYPEFIYEKYDLIDQADYSFSGNDFKYYLFKKK